MDEITRSSNKSKVTNEMAPTTDPILKSDAANTAPCVLTIAGSDSCGGAGIQADIKTMTSLGVFGLSAVTSVTAQNTLGVQSILPVPYDLLEGQINSLITDDIRIKAIKTGVLYDDKMINIIFNCLNSLKERIPLVIDPVMVSTSQDSLIDLNRKSKFVADLKNLLIPLAILIAPNISEAEILTDMKISNLDDVRQCAKLIFSMGAKFVLIKGGHLGPFKIGASSFVIDTLYDGEAYYEFIHPFHFISSSSSSSSNQVHGTGCTLTAAIASYLAFNNCVQDSVLLATQFLHRAISHSFPIGMGSQMLNFGWFSSSSSLDPSIVSPLALIDPIDPSATCIFTQLKKMYIYRWTKYTEHPFIEKLANGSLSSQSFLYFLMQDYQYLKNISTFLKEKTSVSGYSVHYESCQEAYSGEMENFLQTASHFGLSFEKLEKGSPSLTTLAYVEFIKKNLMTDSSIYSHLSLLPCIMGYAEAAEFFMRTKRETNQYEKWISMYSCESYQQFAQSKNNYYISLTLADEDDGDLVTMHC